MTARHDGAGLAAVSIDVDASACYHAIHGLPAPTGDDPMFTVALPRFLEQCERHAIRATLFVVGQDLAHPERAEVLQKAAQAGHELASHSFRHDYALSKGSVASISADLSRAADAIEAACGKRPRGFRAPGYNASDALFDALDAQGVLYDSSFFPTPAYFAARAAAIARYRVMGRQSDSLVGDVREFAAQRTPFHPARGARHRPARKDERAYRFVEIPMGVSSPARLPWLGTSLALFPDVAGKALTQAALAGDRLAVLELHAMDYLGAGDPGVDPALAKAQPDLAISLDDKLRRLDAALKAVAEKRKVFPLVEVAEVVAAQPPQTSREGSPN